MRKVIKVIYDVPDCLGNNAVWRIPAPHTCKLLRRQSWVSVRGINSAALKDRASGAGRDL